MGVLSFLQLPKKGAPTTQIGELEASLARLRAEQKSVQAVVESHGQKRAEMLLSDASDADIAKTDTAADLARIRLERLELAELELTERLKRVVDSAERERLARECETAAGKIEAAVSNIEAAASAILSAAIYHVSPDLFAARPARPAVAGPVVGERILAATMFQDGVISTFLPGHLGEEGVIAPASSLARDALIEPLRDKANRLRAGADSAAGAPQIVRDASQARVADDGPLPRVDGAAG